MADQVLLAEGLGARTRRGWVFRDVDLAVEAGEFVTLSGAAGSGRTSLLLALAGHFRTSAGSVRRSAPAALGFVAGVNEPEPGLTVAEHVEERLVLLGRASWSLRKRRRQALDRLVDVPLRPETLGRDLDPLGAHLLCLALARVNEPGIILADDVDSGLSEVERRTLVEALRDTGAAVVVTAREDVAA
ncbi:ATP-binding cassette domain-containing protein [Dactylosporangium sp. NPDC051485]|uniref:ATP-binding cassette domain-containing protein n=1 Tax=Dactylosporangium sp. NPDC051485 TaxID=3154846 RepID=UPI003435162F